METKKQTVIFFFCILVLTGVLEVTKQDTINAVIAAALQMFVAFGVLNNPTDAANF